MNPQNAIFDYKKCPCIQKGKVVSGVTYFQTTSQNKNENQTRRFGIESKKVLSHKR